MKRPVGQIAVAVVVVLTTVLAGCSDKKEQADTVRAARSVGPGEGALNLVTLPGDVENGGNDARVDWVKPFEERTNCKVGLKQAANAQELLALMSNPSRHYDGAAVPPEAAALLIARKQVAPVNPDLVDGYKNLEPRLRALLKKSNQIYGVPYVWGANLIMFDPKAVQPAPTGWASLFDPEQAKRFAGKLTMRDSPLTLAEAALYLKSIKDRNKSLKITDPYDLSRAQLDAAKAVIAKQRPFVKTYWQQPSDAVGAFASGSVVMGEVWPYHLDVMAKAGRMYGGVAPKEGVTGWMNAWMIGARADHPSCMYQWLKWSATPDVQQQVAEWSGVAPANPQACAGDRLKSAFCSTYHVGDRAYINRVIFAHTPDRDCTRKQPDCVDYTNWTQSWLEARR